MGAGFMTKKYPLPELPENFSWQVNFEYTSMYPYTQHSYRHYQVVVRLANKDVESWQVVAELREDLDLNRSPETTANQIVNMASEVWTGYDTPRRTVAQVQTLATSVRSLIDHPLGIDIL